MKSRKLIEEVFGTGKSFNMFPFRVGYLLRDDGQKLLQAGFGVSSRNFKKAVIRNRIRRLMKESYRHRKNHLEQLLTGTAFSLYLFIIFTGKDLPESAAIAEKMDSITQRFQKLIHEKSSSDT